MNKVWEASSVTPSSVGHSSEATEATTSVLPYSSMDGESVTTDRSTLSSSSYRHHDREHRCEVGLASPTSSPSPSKFIGTSVNGNRDKYYGMKIPSRSLADDYYDEGPSRMSSIDPMTRNDPGQGLQQQQRPYGYFKSNTIDATTKAKTLLISTTNTSVLLKVGEVPHESSSQPHEMSPTSTYPMPPNTIVKKPGVDGTSPSSSATTFARMPAWLSRNQVPRPHQQESLPRMTSLAAPVRQSVRVNSNDDDGRNYSITNNTTSGSPHSLIIEEKEEAIAEEAATAAAADGYRFTDDLNRDAMTHEEEEYDHSESSYYVDDDYTDLESVETDNPQVIAIGIEAPSPRFATQQLARDVHNKQHFLHDPTTGSRRSPEQQQQELLSEATAKDIAQEEHNLKMQLKAAEEQQGIRRRSAPALLSSASKQAQTLLAPTGTGSQQSFGRQYQGSGLSTGRAEYRFSSNRVRSSVPLGGSCNPILQSLSEDDDVEEAETGPTTFLDGTATSLYRRATFHDDDTFDRAMADGIKNGASRSPLMVAPTRFQSSDSATPTRHSMSNGSHSISSVSYDDESVPSETADQPSSRGFSASARDVKLQSMRGAMGVSTKRQDLMIPPQYRSHSTASTAPPVQPIRKSSTDKPTTYSREEDYDDADESLCEPPSLWSCESVQSSQSTVVTSTSGIDLDEKTRERILARSAATLQARRPIRTISGSNNSSSSKGRDNLAAIANSIRMQASSLNATNSPESSMEGDVNWKNTTEEKSRSMHSSSVTSTGSDNSSLNRSPPDHNKDSMSNTSRDSSTVKASSTGKGGSTKPSSRPCDEKADYRKQLNHLASGNRRDNGTHFENQDIEEQELPFRPVTTSDVGSNDETDQRNRMELLEAQAGVPVLLPGAFAVGGSNDDDEAGYDSAFEDTDSLVDGCRGDDDLSPDIEMAQRTGSLDLSMESNVPLEAELYVENVVSAEVLIEPDDTDVKGNRRPSFATMGCMVCVVLIIIGIVLGAMIPNNDKDGAVDENQAGGEGIPVLEGWIQIGKTLEGPADKDTHTILFGESVAISADGNRIAVGLPGASDGLDSALKRTGSVKIFDLINGTIWKESGRIDGTITSGESGKSLKLSYDGKRVAISAPSIEYIGNGHVAVYQESDVGSWELVGEILTGGEKYGDSLGFSGDGRIVAIGDKSAVRSGEEVTGVVKIFQEVDNNWVQMGSDLVGGNQFGWSIALSAEGNRLVASTPENKTFSGIIQTFDFNGELWEEIGRPVKGESAKESFGVAIALSGDGSILASGAPRYSSGGQGLGSGIVRTFRFDENGQTWSLHGQPLEGANQLDVFGSSLSLSFNGEILAVGGPQNNNFCDSCGHVQVFQKQRGNWRRIGSELGNGEMDGGEYGTSVALSFNGTRVRLVGGAPSTTYNGYISKVGQVIVFESVLNETNTSSGRSTTEG